MNDCKFGVVTAFNRVIRNLSEQLFIDIKKFQRFAKPPCCPLNGC
jgi:hypothetical protein